MQAPSSRPAEQPRRPSCLGDGGDVAGAGLRLGICTQCVRSGDPRPQRLASPARRRMGSVGDWPLARPTQEQRENAAAQEPRTGRRGGPRRSSRGGYAPRASQLSGRGRRPGESRGGWRMPCGGGPAMPARPRRAAHPECAHR